MHVGIAADHALFALKKQLPQVLREFGHEVRDFAGPAGSTFGRGIPAGRRIDAANRGWQQTDKGRTVHNTS
jgi:hypothetical protein